MDGVLANLYDYMSVRMFQLKFNQLDDLKVEVFRQIFKEKMYFNHCFPEGAEVLFENLDPFPFNKTLIETVLEFSDEYCILSRPCKHDLQGTKRAKIKWVEKHLAFCPPKDVILVQDKSANGRAKGNILIDDWEAFLTRWTDKGGFALEYKAKDFDASEKVKTHIKTNLCSFLRS